MIQQQIHVMTLIQQQIHVMTLIQQQIHVTTLIQQQIHAIPLIQKHFTTRCAFARRWGSGYRVNAYCGSINASIAGVQNNNLAKT